MGRRAIENLAVGAVPTETVLAKEWQGRSIECLVSSGGGGIRFALGQCKRFAGAMERELLLQIGEPLRLGEGEGVLGQLPGQAGGLQRRQLAPKKGPQTIAQGGRGVGGQI